MEKFTEHISDTAFWIAAFRARETERTDAVFKDSLAKKLAGEKGLNMVLKTPNSDAMAFAMIVRTTSIDRLINSALSEGIDAVINLGAGLDTRPYRLQLPPTLQWIEVDFDGIIQYKNELLAGDKPACNLKRIAANLSDGAERKALFAKLGSEIKSALIITEGVIGYLSNDNAAQLSEDIFNIPAFKFWIMDYNRGAMRRNNQSKKLADTLKHTPLIFDVAEPFSFFSEQGWKIKENISILDEGDRIGRSMPILFPWSFLIKILPPIRNLGNRTYGCVMFCKV